MLVCSKALGLTGMNVMAGKGNICGARKLCVGDYKV